MRDIAHSVLLALALAAAPAVIALCACAWLCWKLFEHEARSLNALLDKLEDRPDEYRVDWMTGRPVIDIPERRGRA
jgi:hypothetical protein